MADYSEAVEAAARAMLAAETSRSYAGVSWDEFSDAYQEEFRRRARVAIHAAAPLIGEQIADAIRDLAAGDHLSDTTVVGFNIARMDAASVARSAATEGGQG